MENVGSPKEMLENVGEAACPVNKWRLKVRELVIATLSPLDLGLSQKVSQI